MIRCKIHGLKFGVQVSKDIAQAIETRKALPTIREFIYTYKEEPYLKMIVSSEFAEANHLPDVSSIDLPDQYPNWNHDLVIVCNECLKNAIEQSPVAYR